MVNVDKTKIEEEAKKLLDKFAKALEKVDSEEPEESFVDRKEFVRKEGDGEVYDPSFKQKILNNAPSKNHDFIIAEKGSWK